MAADGSNVDGAYQSTVLRVSAAAGPPVSAPPSASVPDEQAASARAAVAATEVATRDFLAMVMLP
ncbi:hypothetical protein [Cellulosimicrobium sp. CUA-896]|uniref:hypothetical protein n=1 Tax=Cellulosimicrobium sp. CUA-896 TaxID=1517881 RepID=UPI002101B678|nr:hypothetical protein [Cellulosimicrobium sp. CUA-896]